MQDMDNRNFKMNLGLLISLMVLDVVAQETKAAPPESSKEMRRMLESIQNQWMMKSPGSWISDLYSCDVVWETKMTDLHSPVKYSRRIRQTPDRNFLVAENWNIAPDDLPSFMRHWGQAEVADWDQFNFQKEKNRAFSVPQEGLICIWRFFPSFDQAWKTPPFSLGQLSDEELLPPSKKKRNKKVKQFFSDILLEEILDRNGLGLSLSKTWHFTDQFSRLTGQVQFQRRLRLNTNGLYSVFDTYHLGGEFLLGNVIEENSRHFYSEIGPFLGLSKEVIVIKSGFKSWSDALFSSPFNPKHLPYNEENLRRLPVGIRIVYPHEATLALVAKTNFNYFESSDLNQALRAGMSIKGSVMVSVTKSSKDKVILKVGGRLEKLFDAFFDMSPDFNGSLDPLRLLFGSIVKFRFEGGKGNRVFLEKEIDLNSDEEVVLLKAALKHGILLRGIGFGLKAAVYFIFHPNQERPQEYYEKKIPEINWDQALIGSYKVRDSYFKIGSRPVAYRRGTEIISDYWQVLDYQTSEQQSGYSFSIQSNSNRRGVNGTQNRELMLYGIINDAYPDDVFVTLLDITRDGNWSKKQLDHFQAGWETKLGLPLMIPPQVSEQIPGNYARIGFRLIVSLKALKALKELYKSGALNQTLSEDSELHTWLSHHKVLWIAMRRALKSDNRFLLARTIYKMVKKGAPLGPILNNLQGNQYQLEWIMEDNTRSLMLQQHAGYATVSRRQVMEWMWWNEKKAFEDIFIDVSLTSD